MSELLIPGQGPQSSAFDRRFFTEQFRAGEAPSCDLYAQGEIPVVELELVNGATPDIYCFEAFRHDYLVALLFVDPPRCEDFYRSFIRYETILRVNIRYYKPPVRKLGFKAGQVVVEDEVSESA